MRRIHSRFILAAAGLIAAALAPLPAARAQEPDVTGALTIRLVNTPPVITFIDLRDPGEQTGDYLIAMAKLVDPATQARVGRARGVCFNISGSFETGDFVLECSVTYTLPQGTIVTQGLLTTSPESESAITGGTGRFRNARGQVIGEPQPDGGFFLTFQVLP